MWSAREDPQNLRAAGLRKAVPHPDAGDPRADVRARHHRGRANGLGQDAGLLAARAQADHRPAAPQGWRRAHHLHRGAHARARFADPARSQLFVQGDRLHERLRLRRRAHGRAALGVEEGRGVPRRDAGPADRRPHHFGREDHQPPARGLPRPRRGRPHVRHGLRASNRHVPAEHPPGQAGGNVQRYLADAPGGAVPPGLEETAGDHGRRAEHRRHERHAIRRGPGGVAKVLPLAAAPRRVARTRLHHHLRVATEGCGRDVHGTPEVRLPCPGPPRGPRPARP
mmetsp:Transcript_3645/g.10949  ORF Transcript_3645/g.10949 Transcript_3645/m.10949 type:complete len:283 (+) Transcript_3645:417-1265(+)